MEKVISIIVPCYHSEDYMERCIDSLLLGIEAVEIIIVNDGSTDNTKEIANRYAEMYPAIVKTVHQENGGHGEAINAGLAKATGAYVKVVDSDDWLDPIAYQQCLTFLEATVKKRELIDMVIANYVYDKEGAKKKKVMQYRSFLPVDRKFTWKETRFPIGKYLLMHSVIYRKDILKEMTLQLPKHTFYVDNLYVFQPLPFVTSLYYLDINLYHYYIGREDQSVNEQVMIRRIDQQLFVNKQLVNYYTDTKIEDHYVLKYMRRYVEIITTVSSILLIKEGSSESLQKKRELWNYIYEQDPKLYRNLRHRLPGVGVNLPGYLGRKMAVRIYQVAQRLYGFN